MPQRIRKGDMVVIVSGDERGKRGRVARVLPDKGRIVVEGVNFVFKHLRKSQKNPNGGRIRKEAPIHASNAMPIDPQTNEGTRVSFATVGGVRTRVGRRSRAPLSDAAGRKE